jgi:hypothetical protein
MDTNLAASLLEVGPGVSDYSTDRTPAVCDVAAFCERHGLTEFLATSIRLAEQIFEPISLTKEVAQDYETDDQWIVVRISVRGSAECVLAAKKRYTAEWVAAAPWPQRHQIRLSYNIDSPDGPIPIPPVG